MIFYAYSLSSSIGRDHLGSAVKATQAIVETLEIPLFKEPKTDLSKKSAKGWLKVEKDSEGNLVLLDQVTREDHLTGELQLVFKDGVLIREQSFSEIKSRMWSQK